MLEILEDINRQTETKTNQQLAYFYGVLVEYFMIQHNIDDKGIAVDMLKYEFFYKPSVDINKQPIRTIMSLSSATKKDTTEFIDRIVEWMAENGYTVPYPDDYYIWKARNPSTPNSLYPELVDLKEKHKVV